MFEIFKRPKTSIPSERMDMAMGKGNEQIAGEIASLQERHNQIRTLQDSGASAGKYDSDELTRIEEQIEALRSKLK